MKPDAMTPHGLALLAYVEGQISAEIIFHRDDGVEAFLPVKHYFRTPAEFTPIENAALGNCRGHILDVGAGSGIHSLVLQSKGMPVTAIDICPQTVAIMIKNGVKVALQADIFTYKGNSFDTLLMLGHGIGMVGDIDGLDKFLSHAHNLIRSNGQLLFDSLDVSKSTDAKNIAYHKANRRSGRYIGETRFQMEFQGTKGPFCSWLHIDSKTLAEKASRAGWNCEIILEQESGDYLARLAQHAAVG
jgi:SAM-dependent methyltransferase